MPQPHKSQVHVDRPLSNIAVAYMQRVEEFIAASVFPIVPVGKQSDKYFKYTRADWNRVEAKRRAPGSESAGGGFNITTDSYSCDVFAFHKDVDDQTSTNSDAPIDPFRDATEFVTRQLLLKREVDWASTYFTTSIWGGTDQAGVASDSPGSNQFEQWDRAGSTPIQDVIEMSSEILAATGYEANTLVFGKQVFDALRNHSDIVDRIKYTQGGGAIVTPQLLAALFGVDRVLVAKAIKNTAMEGAAESSSFVFGKAALLCYAAPSPGLMQPSAGYTFAWTGLMPGAVGPAVSRFRINEKKSERVEGEMAYDLKVVGSDLGRFFTTAVG